MQSHHTQVSLESPLFNDLAASRHWKAFQKKFQSLFPQLPQAPVINDTSHSVTDKEHRRGTSVMYGSPEQEINFFFPPKKPKRADQDIVRVLLQRPRLRDSLRDWKSFSSGKKKKSNKRLSSNPGEICIYGELAYKKAADCFGIVYFFVVPWILARFSPTLVIYGGKGWALLCEISIFRLEPQKKKWVRICLSSLNYPVLHCPQRKAIKFPTPLEGFPPHKDCPLKINSLAFLCWWQSQQRTGGGFFLFNCIFS